MKVGAVRVAEERGLTRIADFCQLGLVRTGVDAITVTYANPTSGYDVLFATDALGERIAQLEFAVGQGPTLDAVATSEPVVADDLRSLVWSHRWPLFAPEAVVTGARAVQAYPILTPGGPLGAVGLYSRRPFRLSGQQHRYATDITELIGLALVDPTAVNSVAIKLRMTVHQAAGMVMQQAGTTIQDALVLLRFAAFTEDRPVTDLAADVIARRRRFGENVMSHD